MLLLTTEEMGTTVVTPSTVASPIAPSDITSREFKSQCPSANFYFLFFLFGEPGIKEQGIPTPAAYPEKMDKVIMQAKGQKNLKPKQNGRRESVLEFRIAWFKCAVLVKQNHTGGRMAHSKGREAVRSCLRRHDADLPTEI